MCCKVQLLDHNTHKNTDISPGKAINPDSVFGLCLFGVHLDGELFIHQQDEGDGARVWLHVQQARVFHHKPSAAHTHCD